MGREEDKSILRWVEILLEGKRSVDLMRTVRPRRGIRSIQGGRYQLHSRDRRTEEVDSTRSGVRRDGNFVQGPEQENVGGVGESECEDVRGLKLADVGGRKNEEVAGAAAGEGGSGAGTPMCTFFPGAPPRPSKDQDRLTWPGHLGAFE